MRNYAHDARRRRGGVAGSRRRRRRAPVVRGLRLLFFGPQRRCRTMALRSGVAGPCLRPRRLGICRWATMCDAAWSCGSFRAPRRSCSLLSVHLKSGCARDPLDRLEAKLPGTHAASALPRALDRQPGGRTSCLRGAGGFQSGPAPRAGRPGHSGADIDDGDPPEADLVNTAEGQTFQNCMPSQTFSGYIDYIVLGRRMARGLVARLIRPRALPAKRRGATQIVRPLPGVHQASGGRRHRPIVVDDIFRETH